MTGSESHAALNDADYAEAWASCRFLEAYVAAEAAVRHA